jgi:hypothetical protein
VSIPGSPASYGADRSTTKERLLDKSLMVITRISQLRTGGALDLEEV